MSEKSPSGELDQPLGNLAEGGRLIAIRGSQGRRLAAVGVGTLGQGPPPTRDRGRSCCNMPVAAIMVLSLRTENANGQRAALMRGGSYGDVRPGTWQLGRQCGLAGTGAEAAQGGA